MKAPNGVNSSRVKKVEYSVMGNGGRRPSCAGVVVRTREVETTLAWEGRKGGGEEGRRGGGEVRESCRGCISACALYWRLVRGVCVVRRQKVPAAKSKWRTCTFGAGTTDAEDAVPAPIG